MRPDRAAPKESGRRKGAAFGLGVPTACGGVDSGLRRTPRQVRLKTLAVKRDHARQCLSMEVRARFRSDIVRRTLKSYCAEYVGCQSGIDPPKAANSLPEGYRSSRAGRERNSASLSPAVYGRIGFVERLNTGLGPSRLTVDVFQNNAGPRQSSRSTTAGHRGRACLLACGSLSDTLGSRDMSSGRTIRISS